MEKVQRSVPEAERRRPEITGEAAEKLEEYLKGKAQEVEFGEGLEPDQLLTIISSCDKFLYNQRSHTMWGYRTWRVPATKWDITGKLSIEVLTLSPIIEVTLDDLWEMANRDYNFKYKLQALIKGKMHTVNGTGTPTIEVAGNFLSYVHL